MSTFRILLVLSGMATVGSAQQRIIPVWPGVAPGSEGWTQKEVGYPNPRTSEKMVRNVVTPTLTAFLPDKSKANGTAVLIAPGGGFRFLSWDSEGVFVAEYLKALGVAAFVLKYRLGETPADPAEFERIVSAMLSRLSRATPARESSGAPGTSPVAAAAGAPGAGDDSGLNIQAMAVADARQAMKVVRQHAAEWGIKPDRVGLMGFSAGAIATMGVVMNHDAEARPDFAAPIYGGSTNGAAVPDDAPPLFICVADDDRLMSGSSAKLYTDWKAANKPAELHIYSKGGHGFGLTKHNLPVDTWIDRFRDWLDVQGLLRPAAK